MNKHSRAKCAAIGVTLQSLSAHSAYDINRVFYLLISPALTHSHRILFSTPKMPLSIGVPEHDPIPAEDPSSTASNTQVRHFDELLCQI